MILDGAMLVSSVAAPGGLAITPCIKSDPCCESDCSGIDRCEQGCFGMRLFRFREAYDCVHKYRCHRALHTHTHRCHRPPPGLAFGEPDDKLRRAIQYSRDRSYLRISRGALCPPLSVWLPSVSGG